VAVEIRIRSSFHCTDERSKLPTASPALTAAEPSIRRIVRKISKSTCRNPSSPSVTAISAVRVRLPEKCN
jgi:hypothetical protein